MEWRLNSESILSQPGNNYYIFSDGYISSGLYRYSNSIRNGEPIADSDCERISGYDL